MGDHNSNCITIIFGCYSCNPNLATRGQTLLWVHMFA